MVRKLCDDFKNLVLEIVLGVTFVVGITSVLDP